MVWMHTLGFRDSYCGGLLENIAEGHIITNIHAGEFTFTTYKFVIFRCEVEYYNYINYTL
jgi:hypothetical protein